MADSAKDLLLRMRKDYTRCTSDSQEMENRRKAIEDLQFTNLPGFQWDAWTKKERGNDRPMYEFNKVRITVKRIVNDIRANRPQGKVRGYEDNDKDTAEVYEGLCRNIWNVSDGDTIIDNAAEYQVTGGMCAWRICTDYADESTWEQDIYLEGFLNPFCVYADPAAKDPLKRDAMYWLITDKMAKATYEAKYPNKAVVSFDDESGLDPDDWMDDESVRICEYWYKVPVKKTLYLLEDGATVEQLPQGQKPKRTRIVNSYQIKQVICSGDAILEGPTDWAGTEFPFVMVYGEHVVIEGRKHWFGIVRHAKDAQRSYNYARTSVTETIALAPQAKFWATVDQAKDHTAAWSEAHKKNFPFQLYNADPKSPGPPARMGGAEVPVALIQEAQMASEEIKAVTGIFDNSLGQHANESSGIAIRARAQQGEIATFNYSDNIAKGIRRTWEILIDLIPRIYDTDRAVRILGADGAEKYLRINHADPMTGEIENDVSRGKFDVTITVGPSFSTQRQEAVEAYTQIGQANPQLWAAAGDLMFKAMDLPYSDQIAERWKAMLPPQIQQMIQDGKEVPAEVQAMMAQANQAMQQVQQQGLMVQQAAQEAQAEKADADKAKADVQVAQANLKAQAAQLDAKQSQLEALFAKLQTDLQQQERQIEAKANEQANEQATQEAQQAREQLTQEVAQAMQAIQEQAQQYMEQCAQFMTQMHQGSMQEMQQQSMQASSRPKQIRVKRVNGELVGSIGDGTEQKQVRVKRVNGELVGEILPAAEMIQ